MLRQGMLVCLSVLLFASLPVRAACNTQFVYWWVWTCANIPVFDWFSGLWGITSICMLMLIGTFLDPCPPTNVTPEPIVP